MKNKIKMLSKGDFRMARPEVIFSETNLILVVGEGEVKRGSFTIQNRKDGDIRGLVYCSSFRVKIDEVGFEGNPVEVRFSYDGTGLKPGHVDRGTFTIVCNGGEFHINFTAIIERPYIMTSYGKVQNAKDFKMLAIQDFTEAQRLFRSRDFYEVIKYEEPKIRALYDNMRKWSLGEQAMEEFLIAIKQKETIFLTMGRTQRTFRNLTEDTKETIHFTKSSWGYMPVKVHVDGDFIQITKDSFTTDDFVGNLYDFSYIIRPERTHLGNNYGRIVFESPYESLNYDITVCNHVDHLNDYRDEQMLFAGFLKGYLAVLGGRKDKNEWAKESRELLPTLTMFHDHPEIVQLLDAHMHLICEAERKAESILDSYNYARFSPNRDPIISSYYLYLTALLKKSGSQVNRVVEELNKAFMKNPWSWELACMLADVDPEYRNYTKRLQLLERHYNHGANHLVFFAHSYRCFLENPTSLKKLGAFEVQILNFAVKRRILTKEIALYTANLATQQRTYDKKLDRLLRAMYKAYPDPMILTALCTHMIRGNQTSAECFPWYEKAVKADLKISQLYEYYMMTIDDNYMKESIPKAVILYFSHGNNLNYRKAAVLYANVISYQDEMGSIYSDYREQMERFAWEQLENRRISNTLRIIYKRCIRERDMNAERARAIYDICHAYEVTTSMTNMCWVMVIDPDGSITMRVPYNPDGTVVYLYHKDSRIVWEAKDGRHYMDSIPYETMRLFYESRYSDLVKRYDKDDTEFEWRRESTELTWESLRMYGMDAYDDNDIFKMTSMRIREDGYEEDEFLSMVCFYLFEKGLYDKVTMTYLAEYYCGATRNMKSIWHVARDYDVTTYKLSERIITQMLFSEMMFGEEEIFADYYEGRTYFRLKQAYLAYVSREYVVNCRQVMGCIFAIIANEYRKEEDLADICKIALLKYYSSREVHQELQPMLREFLRQMCEKQIFFSFYLNYPDSWLREVQLYDKSMIEYHARPDSKVSIHYQIVKEDEQDPSEYTTEVLLPSYEDAYIKTFILFENETLRYYFTESGEEEKVTDKHIYEMKKVKPIGRYGRLNDMLYLKSGALERAMTEFAVESKLAGDIFKAY